MALRCLCKYGFMGTEPLSFLRGSAFPLSRHSGVVLFAECTSCQADRIYSLALSQRSLPGLDREHRQVLLLKLFSPWMQIMWNAVCRPEKENRQRHTEPN